MPNLLDHRFKFCLDSLCGLATPRASICKEIGDNGATGVHNVVVIHTIKEGHGGEVGGSVGGNFFPIGADFAGDNVKGSHIFIVLWLCLTIC